MWLWQNPQAHPSGLQRHSWQGSRARRQNAQTSSVLTGCGPEGGAVVQAAMMLANTPPLLVEPQVSLGEAVSEWDRAGHILTLLSC